MPYTIVPPPLLAIAAIQRASSSLDSGRSLLNSRSTRSWILWSIRDRTSSDVHPDTGPRSVSGSIDVAGSDEGSSHRCTPSGPRTPSVSARRNSIPRRLSVDAPARSGEAVPHPAGHGPPVRRVRDVARNGHARTRCTRPSRLSYTIGPCPRAPAKGDDDGRIDGRTDPARARGGLR